jgi:hypothetical protein
MTELEERLRRGMNRYSERIRLESLPPLREPPGRRPRPTVRWLAPVAAAAVVVGVIVGVSLAGQHARRPSGLRTGGSATAAPVPLGPGMPAYYATVFQTYTAAGNPLTMAKVLDSATGAELKSLTVPTLFTQGGANGADITAAANDRTFVIYETGTVSARDRIAWFFLLRVAANGHSATLSRMRVNMPRALAVDYVTLSPNGRMLAMQEQYCPNPGGCEYTGIRVVTIATGAVRTWTTKENGAPFNVSWAGNTRVTFLWEGPGPSGDRLMSLTGPGGNLLTASRPVASPPAEQSGYFPTALVTADGRTVITSTVSSGTGTATAKIVELDAQTGKLLSVLYTVTGPARSLDERCNVLSLGPVGIHILVACPDFGRLDGSVFKPLPGFPSPSRSGISQQSTGAW